MDSVETLIPDNEGNHLVIVLNFYEDSQKTDTFQIPTEFTGLDIADISIEKLNLNQPLGLRAFNKYRWNLFELFYQRNVCKLTKLGIESKDIIVGPKGYQSFARVFYRASHTPIFYLVTNHLDNNMPIRSELIFYFSRCEIRPNL